MQPFKNVNRKNIKCYQNKANLKQLKDIRILQRNSIHLIGIPKEIARPEILKSKQFFGQYGKIKRLSMRRVFPDVQNKKKGFLSIYVTFSSIDEASIAILCLNGFSINKTQLKVSYGLTRYCQTFLKGLQCQRKDCDYKHQLIDPNECCNLQNSHQNEKIKCLKNCDIFEYLISRQFNFNKIFRKHNKIQQKQKHYILPGKDIILKKFQKFIYRQQIQDEHYQMFNPNYQTNKFNNNDQNAINFQKKSFIDNQIQKIDSSFYQPQQINFEIKNIQQEQNSPCFNELKMQDYSYQKGKKQLTNQSEKKIKRQNLKKKKKQQQINSIATPNYQFQYQENNFKQYFINNKQQNDYINQEYIFGVEQDVLNLNQSNFNTFYLHNLNF